MAAIRLGTSGHGREGSYLGRKELNSSTVPPLLAAVFDKAHSCLPCLLVSSSFLLALLAAGHVMCGLCTRVFTPCPSHPRASPGSSSCSPCAPAALQHGGHRLEELFSLHQQLSRGNPACPVTKVNERSLKKYRRGFLYDSTDAWLWCICLLAVALCLGLIGLAVLGEIFILFPSAMIRFVESRAKQRGDMVLNHCYFPAQAFSLPSARKRCVLGPCSCCRMGITPRAKMQIPAQIRASMEAQQAKWAGWEMPSNKERAWNNIGSGADRHSDHKHEAAMLQSALAKLLFPQNLMGGRDPLGRGKAKQ